LTESTCNYTLKPLNDSRGVDAGVYLANPVRSGRKQP
jgi:hypothetical protein